MFLALVLASTGCESTRHGFLPNQLPIVTLTSGPVDTASAPQTWLVEIAWTASDPDGHVDHFEYAVDPPSLKAMRFSASVETAWVSTRERSATIRFRASRPDSLGPGATASEFHTFVLRAVDDDGGISPRLVRAFYAYTVAPDVQILSPRPSALLTALVPPSFRINWQGDDPDGAGSRRPAYYRSRLLTLDDPQTRTILYDPDSLLREGAANGWTDWRTTGADTTSLELSVTPSRSYLFAVVAVDEPGATTAYASLDRNLLQFDAMYPNANGPRIHLSSPLVDFTYDSAGYSNDPLRQISVELSTNTRIRFRWDGFPAPGRVAKYSRYKLDGDPFVETPEPPGDLGTGVWSQLWPASSGTSVSWQTPGEHFLYVELRDDFGDRSLGIVKFSVIESSLERDLLVVDDTRLEVDKFNTPGTLSLYTRPWPSAAELDTFLFARGSAPWRGARNPAGALSTPGLFAGYPFDTLGTRLGLENPANAFTLASLARYRHVLWVVDERAGTFSESLDPRIFPITALAAMSGPGRFNVLGAYVEAGGKVWLAGGGAAFASLRAYDRGINNNGPTTIVTVGDGELGVGRTVYDHAHVRSSMGFVRTGAEPQRSAAAVGGWSRHGPRFDLAAPEYSRLPPSLRFRTPATDPIPPTRASSQGSLFYVGQAANEYVASPNTITESPDRSFGAAPVPTLDTLYDVTATQIPNVNAPVMIYYHGFENESFVFSGFDLWSWTRADAQALVDFVLGDIWHLPRSAVATRPAAIRAATASPRKDAQVRMPASPSTRTRASARMRRPLDPPKPRP